MDLETLMVKSVGILLGWCWYGCIDKYKSCFDVGLKFGWLICVEKFMVGKLWFWECWKWNYVDVSDVEMDILWCL